MKTNIYKERRIKIIEEDIKNIENFHYGFVDYYKGDVDARIIAAEHKKTILVRSLIIEQQLTIEDFIDSLLQITLIKRKNDRSKKTPLEASKYFNALFDDGSKFLSGGSAISFKKKIILLRIMGVISKKLYDNLDSLYSLRNKCGHIWAINSVIRRGTKRSRPKKYVLEFEGKNLYNSTALIPFLKKYSNVLLKIVDITDKY